MIVVTGASGQLGTAFRVLLGDRARYLPRRELDLADLESIWDVLGDLRPSVLINCAAYTAVERAESEPEQAEAVNTVAVGVMAEWMATHRGRFVTFSTDYVFDGTADHPYLESDPAEPINVYGRTKRAGEVAALNACPEALVIRTSWLLSGTHRSFASTMIGLVREGELSVIDDQYGHPTLVNDLALGTMSAIEANATGILHLTNDGTTTWFGLAQETARLAGLDPGRIHPCAAVEHAAVAKTPMNSVIDSERIGDLGLEPLPHYLPSLQEAVGSILSWMPEEH